MFVFNKKAPNTYFIIVFYYCTVLVLSLIFNIMGFLTERDKI